MRFFPFRKRGPESLEGELLFREVQRFRETWLWPVVLVPAVSAAVYVIFVVVKLFMGDDGEGVSAASGALVLGIAFYILKGFGVLLALCYAARLEVEVRSGGIYVRLAPFQFKHRRVAHSDIRRAEIRNYTMFGSPGGRGYRWGRGWRAYTVKGNQAVELETADGHRLLIGSQTPKDLAAAIASVVPA